LGLILLLPGVILVPAAPALAQSSAVVADGSFSPETAVPGRVTVSAAPAPQAKRPIRPIELAVMFGQTVGSLRIYAFAQDRSEELWGVKYIHPSGGFGPIRCDFFIQAIPVYRLIQPKYYDYQSVALTTERRSVFGAAILPLGERVVFTPRQRLQASLYSSGGFAYFTRRILSEGATRFNVNAQFGVEFEFAISDRRSVTFGYAINHLSNGNIHYKNPGLDANLFYLDYAFNLRHPAAAK
jgi:hypothetical protein